MIYTSYFAKLKKLPDNYIPISICGKAPEWYNGLQYKKLAPKYDFFMKWKENHDNEYYIKCFNEQVLNTLNADDVLKELNNLISDSVIILKQDEDNYIKAIVPDIVLICYEKPSDFCHRQLVADWLTKCGYTCKELNI